MPGPMHAERAHASLVNVFKQVAYVWELQGPTPPSLPGFPGTIKKDDLKAMTVKRMRELLKSSPQSIYYGCYEYKDDEEHKEAEFLTVS
jgi:hypothetical protein